MRLLLHVHSSYSYDGSASLEELAAWGTRRGLHAILLSEHTNDFDDAKMRRLVKHCATLPEGGCRLVPGLEFSTRGGFHVLGLNLRSLTRSTEPEEVARFIADQGALAILAHPARYRGSWPEERALARLSGIEAWNARYEGRFLPSGHMLQECARRAGATAQGLLFGGQDLHERTQGRLIETVVEDAGTLEAALASLAAGTSTFGASPVRIRSSAPPGGALVRLAAWGHAGYLLARGLRDRWAAR